MRAAVLALAALLLQGGLERSDEVDATPQGFRYQRPLEVPAGARGQACAVIDAAVYAHSAGRLTELRVYSQGREVPYVQTTSREEGQQEEPARVMNLGRQGKAIMFDLAMPQRAYTEVVLDLDGRDFYATAKISGAQSLGAPRTELGQYALFDLRSRGLSRSTTLALQEASFPVLHVEMTVTPAPGGDTATLTPAMVHGASVPPSREAQTLYTTIATTSAIAVKGRESVATLNVPAHVPIERVRFTLQPGFTKNFSREVRVTAHSSATQDSPGAEIVTGEIQRVRLPASPLGEEIRSEQLSIEALLGANLRSDASVDVAVENGDDAPLGLAAVELQMRQRMLCFEAEPGVAYVLRYGGIEPVRPPVYDYTRLFRASATPVAVKLGPEGPNPDFREEIHTKPYTERHPEVLWVALLLVIAVLGTVALHNARRVGRMK